MRIIKLFILFFIFASLLFSSEKLLEEADKLLDYKNKDSITKSYDNYKSVYLKAIINDDSALAKRAEEGIRKCERLLGSDSFESKQDSKPKKNNRTPPKVTSVNTNKNQIIITLSEPVDISKIEKLTLREKNIIKNVFDIPARLEKSQKIEKSTFFKDIRIAQYTPEYVRVVMEKEADFFVQTDAIGDNLILSAFSKKEETPKEKIVASKPTPKQEPVIRNIKKEKIVFLDPGHGGKDGGAKGYKNILEKDIVLKVSNKAAIELKNRGYAVKTTRDSDIFIELKKRTQMANKENADIFLSIHANSAPSKTEFKGIETYFLSPARSERAESVASKENATDLEVMTSESQKTFLSFLNREKVIASNKFAIDLQKNLLLNLKNNYSNIVDNGVREGPFWVLVGAQMPAVLLEIGYITHPKEAINLNSDDYQNIIAKGIADGIDSYFYHNQ